MIRVLVLFFVVAPAFAEPLYEAKGDGVRVVVYSEPCTLKAEVTNLPTRATWEEKGKVVEGCFGSDGRLAIFYWADKTVVVIPTSQFVRVQGA